MAGFFDKMKTSMGGKMVEASIKSKEVLESARTRAEINELQAQKKAALVALGTAAYAMHLNRNWDTEALTTQCQAIAFIDEQVKGKEEEIGEIHRKADEDLAEQRATG